MATSSQPVIAHHLKADRQLGKADNTLKAILDRAIIYSDLWGTASCLPGTQRSYIA